MKTYIKPSLRSLGLLRLITKFSGEREHGNPHNN
jgi:hypothetical protein